MNLKLIEFIISLIYLLTDDLCDMINCPLNKDENKVE